MHANIDQKFCSFRYKICLIILEELVQQSAEVRPPVRQMLCGAIPQRSSRCEAVRLSQKAASADIFPASDRNILHNCAHCAI